MSQTEQAAKHALPNPPCNKFVLVPDVIQPENPENATANFYYPHATSFLPNSETFKGRYILSKPIECVLNATIQSVAPCDEPVGPTKANTRAGAVRWHARKTARGVAYNSCHSPCISRACGKVQARPAVTPCAMSNAAPWFANDGMPHAAPACAACSVGATRDVVCVVGDLAPTACVECAWIAMETIGGVVHRVVVKPATCTLYSKRVFDMVRKINKTFMQASPFQAFEMANVYCEETRTLCQLDYWVTRVDACTVEIELVFACTHHP